MSLPPDMPDRWWRLYRQERRKLAPKPGKHTPARAITDSEIVRCARAASQRYAEEQG